MKKIIEIVLSAKADNTIHGWKLPFYVFILINLVGTVRSFIYILAPDELVKKSLSTLKKASKITATGDNICKTSSWKYLKGNGNKKR